MIPPNDSRYFSDKSSDPPHESDFRDQYLEATQSFYSNVDSVGSQSDGSSCAASLAPTWFTEFIAYDSDDPDFQPDSMSVSQTSGSVRMDTASDITTAFLVASPSGSVPILTDTAMFNSTSVDQWSYPTYLDGADCAVGLGSNTPYIQWNPAEPALQVSAHSHSENPPNEDYSQSLLAYSKSAQNDVVGRTLVPRMRSFPCPTCQVLFTSESRRKQHLQKSHAPARFVCTTCTRGFKQEKDLKRHHATHDALHRPFACTCTKTYARYDGLLRHISDMARRPQEAGCHAAVKSNPNEPIELAARMATAAAGAG